MILTGVTWYQIIKYLSIYLLYKQIILKAEWEFASPIRYTANSYIQHGYILAIQLAYYTSLSFWIAVLTAYFTSSFKPLSVARLCWWLGALSLKYYKYYINTDTSTIKTSMTNTGGDKFKQTTKKNKWLALEVIISFHTLSMWTSIHLATMTKLI